MNGSLGRVDGGIGIALDDPAILIEAQASPSLEKPGCDPVTAQRIRDGAEHRSREDPRGKQRARSRCVTTSLADTGLGAGSQLALATARACCELDREDHDHR